jgi:hypothetical protein
LIPTLSLMIAAYVGFRMIEVFLLADSRYRNDGAKIAACVLAALALIVIGISAISILAAGTDIPSFKP